MTITYMSKSKFNFAIMHLLQYINTHPNICKLWLNQLVNYPTIETYNQLNIAIRNMNTNGDLTKLNIISLHCLVYT